MSKYVNIPPYYDRPKECGEAWTLRKGDRVASCHMWTHPLGGEARVTVDGELVRSEVRRDGMELIELGIRVEGAVSREGLGTVVGILDTLRETVGLIQKIDNIELYRQVLDLQTQSWPLSRKTEVSRNGSQRARVSRGAATRTGVDSTMVRTVPDAGTLMASLFACKAECRSCTNSNARHARPQRITRRPSWREHDRRHLREKID